MSSTQESSQGGSASASAASSNPSSFKRKQGRVAGTPAGRNPAGATTVHQSSGNKKGKTEKKKKQQNETSGNKQSANHRNDAHQENNQKGTEGKHKPKRQKPRQRNLKSNAANGKDDKPGHPTQQEMEEMAKIKAEKERNEALVEAQKLEAERIARLEKRRAELESDFNSRVSRIQSFVESALQHKRCRQLMAPQELTNSQATFQHMKKNLKSDLKKCTAFCKKIKSSQAFDDAFVESLLKDLDTINLTRYLEEISNAFLDQSSSSSRKLKVGDVKGVVKVLIALHQRYTEFMMDIFLPQIIGCLKGKQDQVDSKQKRIYMRILTELLKNGVLIEAKPVMKILAEAAGVSKGDGSEYQEERYSVTDPALLLAFAKAAGFELIGVIPKSIVQDVDFVLQQKKLSKDIDVEAGAEQVYSQTTDQRNMDNCDEAKQTHDRVEHEIIVVSELVLIEGVKFIDQFESIKNERAVSDEICNRFRKHLTGAMECLSTSLISTHKKLGKMRKRCDQDRLLAGSLTEQREKSLKEAQYLLESLKTSVETLAEVLNDEMPILLEEEETKKDDITSGLEIYKGEDGQEINLGPFDDEETRNFYCDIPDLLTTIPPALLGYSAEDVERMQEVNTEKYGSGFVYEDNRDDILVDDCQMPENDLDLEKSSYREEGPDAPIDEETTPEDKETPHYKLTVLLDHELPECNRRELVDQLAEKFCTVHGANKNARKRIEKAMFLIPRSRLDLIPYYSRLAAIFDRVFPDISKSLVNDLEQQFHGLARWKKQQGIDSRIRNARFIGELTKFKVAPPLVSIRCLQRCIQDFSGYNVDVACCLLESCGRFLYRTEHTAPKLAEVMEKITRIRKAKHFDERSIEMMNSAFYMIQPPKLRSVKKAKNLSITEEYLKDLIMNRLNKTNISFISKQILRFPWNDQSVDYGELVVKYILKACRKGRFDSIKAVASVAASTKKSRPEVVARLIDVLLEEIQRIIENPSVRDQQRAVVYTKLFGELHSNALVVSEMIFDLLYKFINFGHDISDGLREASSAKSLNEASSMPSILKSTLGVNKIINEDEESDNECDEKEEEKTSHIFVAPVAVSSFSKYDPRVPSALDPPSSVFRIKLVCTLLDSCVSSFVTHQNFPKLESFLAVFQRYIFIKNALPTDIEFSLLDTFDLLESTLKLIRKNTKGVFEIVRFKSWFDAHTSVVKAEEIEVLAKEKIRKRLLSQAGIIAGGDEMMDYQDFLDDSSAGEMSVDSTDDNRSDEMTVTDELGSECHEDLEDDEEASSEEGSDIDDTAELIDEDQAYEDESDVLRKLEDEAFERELRKLTLEAIEKGKSSARIMAASKVSDSMPSASQFSRSKTMQATASEEAGNSSMFTLNGSTGMNFTLIKRGRKGRSETKQLIVPIDTNLAKVATTQDTEAALERDMLKARVLRYEAESAVNSYSGDVYLDQEQVPEVRNRSLRNIDIDKQFGRSTPLSGRGPIRGRGSIGGRGLKRF